MMEQAERPSPEKVELLRLRLEMVQIWSVFLFNNEHRCLLNHICAETEAGREVTLRSLSEFKNSTNLAHDLRNGFLLTLIENRQEKTSIVRVNPQFVGTLGRLIEMIKGRINPELEKIKQFNPQEKKKVCTVCKVEKTESEINFMGPKCECATPHFVDIKQDPEKKARYDQLERLLAEIIPRKKRYDDLEAFVLRKEKERSEMKERRMSDLERFLEKQGLLGVESKVKVEKNYQNLMLAIKMFSPNREYEKVNELIAIREARRQRARIEGDRSPFF